MNNINQLETALSLGFPHVRHEQALESILFSASQSI